MHECPVTFIGRLSVRNLGTLFTFMKEFILFYITNNKPFCGKHLFLVVIFKFKLLLYPCKSINPSSSLHNEA